ncbi:MAG: HD domain-containing protein [Bacilli bacterium]|nr:HD domain-containing protein [Bacilli bacterium]
MEKIKDFNPGDEASLYLRFSDIQFKKTQANADYASMLGFDGKDLIDVKMWALKEEEKTILKNGEIYLASGRMKDYQGKMQFNVVSIREITSKDDINMEDFFEYAPMKKSELENEIAGYIKKIKNKNLFEIVTLIFKKYHKEFFLHPAAMTMHHNYYSGLAYHTYSMLKLSDAYLDLYKFLNKDLVYSGVLLHDIGKVVELSGPKGTEYTKEGNLLGHIFIGSSEVSKTANELGIESSDEVISLIHIMLSHHGKLEFGSPKEPMIAEAVLIHYLDLSDSRLASLEKDLDKTEEGHFTEQLNAFDRRNFYKPKI